jgi:hypothetical protein
MRRRLLGRGAGLLPALLLAVLAATPAGAADFLDSYKAGLAAVAAGNWQEAADRMREAIALRPDESVRLTLRFYFKPYVPQYYLGRALFELGDCAGALAAWEESEGQGAVQRLPEYQDLQTKRWTCKQRLESAAAARAMAIGWARGKIEAAVEADKALASLAADPDLRGVWTLGDPPLARRRQAAQEQLQEARRRLTARAEGGSAEEIRAAGTLADAAREALEAVRQEAEAGAREQRQAGRELRRQIDELAAGARRELAGMESLAPYPAGLSRQRDEVEGILAEVAGLDPGAGADALGGLKGRLTTALVRLRRELTPPPQALAEAAGAFFGGDYDKAVELLDGASLPGSRATAQGHLFLAAARFALYSRGGGQPESLLAAARQDVLACHQADAALLPLPQAFSPRFRSFFAATLAAAEPADAAGAAAAESEQAAAPPPPAP